MNTKKVYVTLEEHLTREVPIEVSADITDPDERMEIAYKLVRDKYYNHEIVLDDSDFNGVTFYSIRDEETGIETEWGEL